MILVDTSVWVNHLRQADSRLAARLTHNSALVHPFAIVEIACRNLRNRSTVPRHLEALPAARAASHSEVLHLVERHRLFGQGIGWVDLRLLASALLTRCHFWTRDSRLDRLARRRGLNP